MHSRLGLIPTFIAIILLLCLAFFAPKLIRVHPGAWVPDLNLFSEDAPPKPSSNVWVDLRSGIYYCHDSRFYHKMRPGFFMKQGLALQKGYRPSRGKPCP